MPTSLCSRVLLLCGFLASSVVGTSGEPVKPDVGFIPTPQRVVEAMLQMAEVKKGDVVYDLGCGDGRLVILAAKQYGARGVGIDIDPERVTDAKQKAAAVKVDGLVEFRQANIFATDFTSATVITLYLLNELNVRLRPQIFAQVKPGTRVVSHAFRMGDWEADVQREVKLGVSSYDTFLWIVPANLSGRWRVSRRENIAGLPDVVVIEQVFQRITAKSGATGALLGEGKLSGRAFVLSLNHAGGEKPVTFKGTVEGGTLIAAAEGRRGSWKAEREPGTEKPLEPAR